MMGWPVPKGGRRDRKKKQIKRSYRKRPIKGRYGCGDLSFTKTEGDLPLGLHPITR